MKFRLILYGLLALWLIPTAGYSIENVRVIVLPFEIHSPDNQSNFEKEISSIIKTHLKTEGAVVIDPDISDGVVRDVQKIRQIGIRNGADYLIWGSMTKIGNRFSLDGKMVESFGDKPVVAVYQEGTGIENLPALVKKLAVEFSLRIFKREKVAEVRIVGNKRIETDAIKRVIKTQPGDVYLAKSLSEDLKAVFGMGYFEDIRIEYEDSPKGKIVIFSVVEKQTIRQILFKNNRVYDDKDLSDIMSIKSGSILNIYDIKNNVKRIESLYKDKNYHNVRVTYNIIPVQQSQADLEFVIEEGEKVRIKEIIFSGIQAYSPNELKKIMKTSEKGFWSWLTSSGELNREDLNQDVERITAHYQNNGYINARVGEPTVEFKPDGIYISIKIDEGARFKVGKVKIEGENKEDLIKPVDELQKYLKIPLETYVNREVVRKDVLALTDLYSDEGYAYAEIIPKMDKNMSALQADITYSIRKGKQVYFEKIFITGNTKTRDKVIRRELKVYEQDLYSGKKLKRGIRNLYRLDYFEDIKVNTDKGSSDDKMILSIDVKEKPTGTFSFGGGYSSVENFFGMASIMQRNLFGRGQTLQLKAEIGGKTTRFSLSFNEPWLFDIPLSTTVKLYNWESDYDTYEKDSIGGGISFGYPVYDYTTAYLTYGYDVGDIYDITEDASSLVWDMEGKHITSSVTASLRYDSRDRMFNPTEGADHSISVEYAGLGGDIGFIKYIGELGQYIPLFWGTVGFLHAKGGYVKENPNGKLPDYERFYLGGMNSIRGFDWRDICVYDDAGDKIGGDKFVQFNAEYLIPLVKKAGVVGVIFFDTGNVYKESDPINFSTFRESAGFGFRWYSPMGPIRVENGYILDPKEGESKSGKWEFTIGGAF